MTHSHFMTRRSCLALGASALLARPALAAAKQPAIVELFTSQGCSSCPPADAFMRDLVKRGDVIALSYNVDYWDYLGWKDTLGSAYNSKRQYDYAKSRGDMDVYTPQMVINGGNHFVGSNRSAVGDAIDASFGTGAERVGLKMEEDGKELVISAAAASAPVEGTLWLMAVSPLVKVQIERGENAGTAVSYHNAVRKCLAAGMWKGDTLNLRVPKGEVMEKGASAVVALLQAGHVGAILGAARLGSVSS
jgi:hypothetical protein